MTSKDILSQFGSLLEETTIEPVVTVPFEVRNNITHKLTLHRGRAKNFRSIGNEFMEIDYQRNQATLVTSDDNGAGKSTMLVWLLFFVLYNDTYSKKEKKAGLVNSQNKKDCVGEIEFSCRGSEWKARRGIKPDFIEVYQKVDGDWKQITADAAKNDMNKYLVNLIGVDQKMFENSLVLGKEKYIPFSEMYTADRRAMVETIWDLGFFSIMNEEAKAAIKGINKELEDISNTFGLKIVDHTNKKTQLAQIIQSNALIQQQSAEILEQEEQRLSQVQTEIRDMEAERNELADAITQSQERIETISSEIQESVKDELESLKQNYESEVKIINNNLEDKINDYQMIELASAHSALNAITTRLEEKVKEKNEVIDKRNTNLDVLQAAIAKKTQAESFRVRFETEISGHRNAIQRFHDMGVCPTCTQQVTDDTKAGVLAQYQPQITDLEGKIKQVDDVMANILNDITTHQAEDSKLADILKGMDAEIESLKEEGREAKKAIETLERDIQDFRTQAQNEINSLTRERYAKTEAINQSVTQRIADITAGLRQSIQQSEASLDIVNGKIGEHRRREDALGASIAELQRKLAIQPTPTEGLESQIAELEAELNDLETRRQQADENLQDHNTLLHFLKDDQTKARIIALYLPFLNSKINEYLEALNMFLDIVVDDTFEITMSAAGRKGQSIFSLSTGQRARLNLAITLALRDVANLKASVQCNLFVLDEILENMSERGVQESVEMLKHKFGGNNLFVISQREQEFQEYFEHNIRYGLRNGMTEVINKE
ncbi:exonuclease subunit 2 [Salmonella phage CRW-SP2]|nr:exonuclease subunit 2 [Salmonella phage CRW-SP2]